MKLLAAIVVASVAGAANARPAFEFSPLSTQFQALGSVTITAPQGSHSCSMRWMGTTGNVPKHAHIMRADFSGTFPYCEIGTSGAPWALTATGAGAGQILNFDFGPAGKGGLGPCGPSTVPFTVNSSGVWTFNATMAGGCTISGSLPTEPPITIVPAAAP